MHEFSVICRELDRERKSPVHRADKKAISALDLERLPRCSENSARSTGSSSMPPVTARYRIPNERARVSSRPSQPTKTILPRDDRVSGACETVGKKNYRSLMLRFPFFSRVKPLLPGEAARTIARLFLLPDSSCCCCFSSGDRDRGPKTTTFR